MAELDELFGNEKPTTMEPYSKDDWITIWIKNSVYMHRLQLNL